MSHTQPGLKKIAVMGSGAIGMELALNNLQKQYPGVQIAIWNRESDRGINAAISGDQKMGISSKIRRGNSDTPSSILYTNDMDTAMRDADIVVIAGGIPRKSDTQPRTDLAKDNIPFIDPIAEKAGELARENPAKKTNFIIGTNPIGLIDRRFQEVSGIAHNQIVGLSGELDVERLRQSIRLNLHVNYEDIRGEVTLGDHGPNMVPVFSQIEIRKDGQWQKLLDLPQVQENNGALLAELKNATVKGGSKLVKWGGTSDFRAPAAALAYMVEQVVDARWGDKSASQPVTASTFVPDAGVYTGQTVRFNEDGTYSLAKQPALNDAETTALADCIAKAKGENEKFQALARFTRSTGLDEREAGGGIGK